MPRPNDASGSLRSAPGPFQRIPLAAIGLLAGDLALLILMLSLFRPLDHAREVFWIYAIFSIVGWVLVGLPVAALVPARLVSQLSWPHRILVGATLGPLAVLLIVVLLLVKQGRLREFSLDHSEALWPTSMLVSTVSFLVYVALLRWRCAHNPMTEPRP